MDMALTTYERDLVNEIVAARGDFRIVGYNRDIRADDIRIWATQPHITAALSHLQRALPDSLHRDLPKAPPASVHVELIQRDSVDLSGEFVECARPSQPAEVCCNSGGPSPRALPAEHQTAP
jgi:hypothetical protein